MGGRTAVPAAVAAWLGLLAGGATGAAGAWLVAGAALTLAAAVASRGARAAEAPFEARVWLADALATALVLAALFAAAGARGAAHHAALAAARAGVHEEAVVRLSGRVVAPPLRESGEPSALVAVEAATPPLPTGTRLVLRLPPGAVAEWGDRIEALARLDLPRPATNPGGRDARAAADAAAVAATGRAFDAVARRATGVAAWPRATAARWRRALERRFALHLGAGARALVTPLVVGDRTALPTDLASALRAAGLVHLIALSGLHVAWLAGAARAACAAAGGGVGARALAGALAAACYAGLAGPVPSLLRAAATEALAALARLVRRPLDGVQALALSALLLLVAAPGFAVDLGFQLSCAATLGLAALGGPLARALAPPAAWRAGRLRPAGALAAALAAVAAPTLAAQATAWPLLAARFHAVSWTGPLANLAAVPLCGLLLAAAWIGALVDAAAPGLGRPWLAACEPLAAALRAVADAAAGAPLALLPVGSEPGIAWAGGAAAALLAWSASGPRAAQDAARPLPRWRTAARAAGAVLLALSLLLAASARPARPAPGRWWLVALDAGQGDALALAFPGGWWLVDAGPRTPSRDAGESVVLPFLRWAGVRRLEALVLTHDDGDHTGGARAVLRGVAVRRVIAPAPHPGAAGPAASFGARAAARGDTLARAPAVVALWPPRPGADPAWAPLTDNEASLVLLVGEGRGRALLAADADSATERALGVPESVAVLKAGHHGAGSSSGARWLAALRPQRAVISCGRRNAFGHPDPRALARLAAAGAAVHRTDRDGAVWLEFDARGVRVVEWRAARRPHDAPARRAAPAAPPARPPARP
uniref:DNA internalization-related competence protein ComEC/Rec2 n=1 Tax=Eiseniibacteriota bacterium TaxID=2212470 RepID=A0A832HYT1_UNCEI